MLVSSVSCSCGADLALPNGGMVVTWGDAANGGDSKPVAEQLKGGVVSVCSSGGAFAALKVEGSVVTWGSTLKPSDEVSKVLSGSVARLCGNCAAFCALKPRP
mmetsp:Transcript_83461/g.194041  ORF Transcript_83461/g.194041 Transcript_83461/m.194041 type:complete len:103 (-) Transcript_83461:21-329(-)